MNMIFARRLAGSTAQLLRPHLGGMQGHALRWQAGAPRQLSFLTHVLPSTDDKTHVPVPTVRPTRVVADPKPVMSLIGDSIHLAQETGNEEWSVDTIIGSAAAGADVALPDGEEDWAFIASRYNDIAFSKIREGAINEALQVLEHTTEVVGRGHGSKDIDLVDTLLGFYVVHMRKGEFNEAVKYGMRRSELITEILEGFDTSNKSNNVLIMGQVIALVRNNINVAAAYEKMGDLESAMNVAEKAEDVAVKWSMLMYKSDDYRVIDEVLILQNHLLTRMGRVLESERILRKVVATRERRLGLDAPAVSITVDMLAANLEIQGRMVEAEMAYRRVIENRKKESRHPVESLTAVTVVKLAKLYHKTGRMKEARANFRKALKMRETFYGATHAVVIETLQEYLAFVESVPEFQDDVDKVRERIHLLKSYTPDPEAAKKRGRRPKRPHMLTNPSLVDEFDEFESNDSVHVGF